ncbi:unnamed protein product, partial [Prunus brigantina]
GRGTKGRGVATINGGVDTSSANASGTIGVRGIGVVRGRCVVSEQQQTQATPKFKFPTCESFKFTSSFTTHPKFTSSSRFKLTSSNFISSLRFKFTTSNNGNFSKKA